MRMAFPPLFCGVFKHRPGGVFPIRTGCVQCSTAAGERQDAPVGAMPRTACAGNRIRRMRGGSFRIHRRFRFCGDTATVPPAAPSFLSQEKRWWRKECLGTRNSAYARKGILLRCACYRYTVRSPNALRATVESGFCIARYALRVVMCSPVEYLTYGSRDVSDLT